MDDRPLSLSEYGRRKGLKAPSKPEYEHVIARSTLRKSVGAEQPRSPTVTRSAGKPKPELEADSLERRSSRFSSRRTYNEEDSAASEDDVAGDKDQTYDRDYVNAHPNEDFYHTGNGWYKRGQRPKAGAKAPKKRDSVGNASTRRASEGTFKFEPNQTIHSTQLSLYPNLEFHHCGNGWYKVGPDATGHRTSTIIEPSPSEMRSSQDPKADEDLYDDSFVDNTTVDRATAKAHPEIQWVHRGNGRYKMKVPASRAVVDAQSGSEDLGPAPKGDTKTYSREYVDAHPEQEFHHRGNARYMKGPPPAKWAEARKQRRKSLLTEASTAQEATPYDDNMLYDKAWVEAHPHELYHHRGQGRWARGPRQPRASLAQSAVDEDEDEDVEEEVVSDTDPDELVDTKYVETHPHETFHHRGQGRWARGLPPVGASNKTAVRGPGGSASRISASMSQAEEEEEEESANPPPGLTDLVLKVDGPVKFPDLTWHYRGGGKWARLSKHEAENLHRQATGRKPKGRARKSLDGATAQLEREAAAAEAIGYEDEDEDGYGLVDQSAARSRPAARRRRTNNTRDSFNTMDDEGLLSKQSSQKSVSQAPTPKPRVMTLEEDVLTDDDLPALYRDEWTPPTDDLDEADAVLRQRFRPMNGPEAFLKGLTKYEPNTRPTENLLAMAENTDLALQAMAAEFIELDKLTAPHRRVPGKPAKGGTVPIDPLTWEDKKEADLYDYTFDPRKIGEQDPDAQRIQRDAEGRELRGRRNRSAFHNTGTVPGWNFGEDQPLGSRRAVRAPQRFDGVVAPPRKRARGSNAATRGTSQAPSLTPERAQTPLAEAAGVLPLPVNGRGRLLGEIIPSKRVQELRGESAAPAAGGGGRASKETSPVRKGRPPGSKNLHKRKDAGIKKGPRKPKVSKSFGGGVGEVGSQVEGDGEAYSVPQGEGWDGDGGMGSAGVNVGVGEEKGRRSDVHPSGQYW